MCLALAKIDRHFGCSFGGFHLQRNDVGVRREFVQAGVNGGIEEFAAPVGATGFGDGNFAVLHREFSDDAVRKVAERSGGGGENFAGDGVTFVAKLADQGENAGEDVVRIFDYPVENAGPLRAAQPLQHFGGESGLRAAIFFRTHHGGEGATANVECAAFIAEPGAASSGARGVAVSVASIGCGAGAYYQYYSFAFTHGGIQGDGEIGSDSDCGFGKCALEKRGDAFGDGFAAGAADARADTANVASFQVMALEDDVGGVAEREPGLGVSGAERIRRARRGAREDIGFRVHQNTIGFCAAAIETQIESSFWRGILFSHSFHHA
jgi:hypothetical protein